jgi:mannose-6-phosphate isomerase
LEPESVYLVEGGVPHAIGSGCFLVEIQEPTDLTLRVERTTPRGNGVPDVGVIKGSALTVCSTVFNTKG